MAMHSPAFQKASNLKLQKPNPAFPSKLCCGEPATAGSAVGWLHHRSGGPTAAPRLQDMQELLQRSSVARSGLSSYGQTHAVLMWQCERNGLQQDAACPTGGWV